MIAKRLAGKCGHTHCYSQRMSVELRPLAHSDAQAHCQGEDEETVRWLSGGYNTVEGARLF